MAKKGNKASEDPDTSEKIEVKSAPKVNDIAKPGETPSSPTSRPIITGHGGMIKKDPMVAGKPSDDDSEDKLEEKDQQQTSTKAEMKIEPVGPSEEPGEDEKENQPEDNQQREESHEDENKSAEEEKPEQENPDNPDSDSAAIDSLASNAEKKTSSKASDEEQKKVEKVQELIASKKYHVPIVEGGHKASSQRFATWLLLFLLLVAIGVYLAIDAGYIDVGISLPFDLIKN